MGAAFRRSLLSNNRHSFTQIDKPNTSLGYFELGVLAPPSRFIIENILILINFNKMINYNFYILINIVLPSKVSRSTHVKSLWSGGGVLTTRDRLFTKVILQRHHTTEAQTPYSYHHDCSIIFLSSLFFTILAIK